MKKPEEEMVFSAGKEGKDSREAIATPVLRRGGE